MEQLKIRSKGMIGTHHSWAVTMRSLFDHWIKQGHDCYITTMNNYDCVPTDWERFINRDYHSPDLDICYTLPYNFDSRFAKKSRVKMAIYNYETSRMPAEWAAKLKHVDYLLPSSNFSREVFINSGCDPDKCVVIPHGINPADFLDDRTVALGNKKKFRFLNVSIAHYRKNLNILLEAYYSAFTSKDDVCLVIKTDLIGPKNRKRYSFEVDLEKQFRLIQQYYVQKRGKDLPQVEIVQQRFPSMIPLYNSCDALVSASSSEGFGLPLLEGMAANMLIVSPRCTGQLDFLNDKNSVLYDVKEVLADKRYQYWRPTEGATTFMPHKDDLAQAMLYTYQNRDKLRKDFEEERVRTLEEFTWENAANKILELV
jgi:glycosyltransferase involved in cell wall biosynthesis